MAETFTNSGIVKLRAGTNHTALTADQYTELIEQAQADILAEIKDESKDWIADYGDLDSDKKKLFDLAASSHAAIGAIMNDPLALGGLAVATTAINTNLSLYQRAITKLKEKVVTDWLQEK